jgi:hypothetical protein
MGHLVKRLTTWQDESVAVIYPASPVERIGLRAIMEFAHREPTNCRASAGHVSYRLYPDGGPTAFRHELRSHSATRGVVLIVFRLRIFCTEVVHAATRITWSPSKSRSWYQTAQAMRTSLFASATAAWFACELRARFSAHFWSCEAAGHGIPGVVRRSVLRGRRG